jgi:F0F1-type ATP synthase assembly protein I
VVKFNPEDYSGLGLAVNLALSIAVPLFAGILLGQYLGEKFGNPPLFILSGVLLGLFAGFRQAIRLLLKK